MTWHVITLVGEADEYSPALNAAAPRLVTAFERPTHPHRVPNDVLAVLRAALAVSPPAHAMDLLYLAMTVYSADLRVNRIHGTDRWCRDFVLHLPVTNVDRWRHAQEILIRMLQFLTGDRWQVELRPRQVADESEHSAEHPVDVVSLFSGGLDSLVGAIDLLASEKTVALVGHHGAGMTNAIQADVLARLEEFYAGSFSPYMFFVQPSSSGQDDGEKSTRSRSLLFLALGVALSQSLSTSPPLFVAENGLISLNVPLVPSRDGSSSTRTTHPHFLSTYAEFLSAIDLTTPIEAPYRFKTKGEMLSGCRSVDALRACAPLSMSCSHPESGRFGKNSPRNHCGYCVPCIIRRASLQAAGFPHTKYNIDVVTSPPKASSKTGSDLRAFSIALERLRTVRPSRYLFDILGTGPIPPSDAANYADVYRRGMEEVGALLR